MARGRLLSKTLGTSRKFAALHGIIPNLAEFAQALYPLLIANTDDFGRLSGDAFSVKHAVFPTSPRTEDDFESAIAAMATAGLLVRYGGDGGEPVIQIAQFEQHQSGLHKRTKSRFPDPANRPTSLEPIGLSRKVPDVPSEENRTEGKGIEGADAPGLAEAWSDWSEEWRTSGHRMLSLQCPKVDEVKFLELARRFPESGWRRTLLHGFFNTAYDDIRAKPPVIGWFLYWADWIDTEYRKAGKRPASEVAA